mmetsp:Transcript_21740/g.66987  ORF Transcript_21740/g.66987 Transcript_21740/m.66987 type:complete len:200 (-) Transcript_21740:36-635(-)
MVQSRRRRRRRISEGAALIDEDAVEAFVGFGALDDFLGLDAEAEGEDGPDGGDDGELVKGVEGVLGGGLDEGLDEVGDDEELQAEGEEPRELEAHASHRRRAAPDSAVERDQHLEGRLLRERVRQGQTKVHEGQQGTAGQDGRADDRQALHRQLRQLRLDLALHHPRRPNWPSSSRRRNEEAQREDHRDELSQPAPAET